MIDSLLEVCMQINVVIYLLWFEKPFYEPIYHRNSIYLHTLYCNPQNKRENNNKHRLQEQR